MTDDTEKERQLPPAVGRLIAPRQDQAGIAVAKDGRRYRIANIQRAGGIETMQLEREQSKAKGKAARKAEKRRRRKECHNNGIVTGSKREDVTDGEG